MTKQQLSEVITNYPKASSEYYGHLFVDQGEIKNTLDQGLDPLWTGKSSAADTVRELKPKLDELLQRISDGKNKQ